MLRTFAYLLSVVIIALVAAGCSSATPRPVAATVFAAPGAAKVGNAAPDFILEKLNGGTIDTRATRGHPLIVHFWASWCQPCRDEALRLETAAEKYRSKGLEILALTNESEQSEVARFVRERDLSFTILLDPDSTVFDAYRVTGIPASFFVDANGVIRSVVPGPLASSTLDADVAGILAPIP